MSDFLDRRRDQIAAQNRLAASGNGVGGGGGDTTPPDVDIRLSKVEAGLKDVTTTLQRMEPVLTRLDERLRKIEAEGLPKIAVDVAEVKGRISQLPTTAAIFAYMGGLVTLSLAVGGVAFVIVRAAAMH